MEVRKLESDEVTVIVIDYFLFDFQAYSRHVWYFSAGVLFLEKVLVHVTIYMCTNFECSFISNDTLLKDIELCIFMCVRSLRGVGRV